MSEVEWSSRPRAAHLVDTLTVALLVFLFGFAAIDKMFHVRGFIKAINSYRLLPLPMGE